MAKKETKVKEEKKEVKGKKAEVKVSKATVYSATGNVVRTYTEEHSDKDTGFVEKAKGYATKIGGTMKTA